MQWALCRGEEQAAQHCRSFLPGAIPASQTNLACPRATAVTQRWRPCQSPPPPRAASPPAATQDAATGRWEAELEVTAILGSGSTLAPDWGTSAAKPACLLHRVQAGSVRVACKAVQHQCSTFVQAGMQAATHAHVVLMQHVHPTVRGVGDAGRLSNDEPAICEGANKAGKLRAGKGLCLSWRPLGRAAVCLAGHASGAGAGHWEADSGRHAASRGTSARCEQTCGALCIVLDGIWARDAVDRAAGGGQGRARRTEPRQRSAERCSAKRTAQHRAC